MFGALTTLDLHVVRTGDAEILTVTSAFSSRMVSMMGGQLTIEEYIETGSSRVLYLAVLSVLSQRQRGIIRRIVPSAEPSATPPA